jgi:hypothetical protein
MGTNASQRRAAGSIRCIDVYPADVSLGWRIVRQVTPEFAYKKVLDGQWREAFDDCGNFLGCQVIAAIGIDRELSDEEESASTITAHENRLNAGLDGRSRTIGMSEDRRITRRHPKTWSALPPEDAIERAIAKVQQWPYPASRIDNGRGPIAYGDRAIRVNPRVV